MKKVTKKLAKEIATKFFGKAVKLVEDIDPTKQRVFFNDGLRMQVHSLSVQRMA